MKKKSDTQENGKRIALKIKQLRYQYPDGTLGVDGVTFEIEEFEKVAVIGPNGSGKSTLITLMNGVRRGTGDIDVFGIRIETKNLQLIKRQVGLVFQNPDDQLFCPTIYEDVAFGPLNLGLSTEDIQERVEAALHIVGLENIGHRSSFHLSFGERKLASLATVLSMDPQVIALDEPTSNLDLAHRRKIIRWIQKNKKTIILTTHDLDMVLETCQRVILLNRGQIMADGETSVILKNQDLLETNELELPLSIKC